jgi:hypothetical protein
MVVALRGGAGLGLGIDHEHYRHSVPEVSPEVRTALSADLTWRRS